MNLTRRCLSATAVVLTGPTSTAGALSRAALFLALYVTTSWVGSFSIIPTLATSLIWPAAGVATFWICTSTRRSLPWDLGALALGAVLVSATANDTLLHTPARVVSALAMALVFRTLARHGSALLADPLGGMAVRSLRTFVVIAAAGAAAALVEAVVTTGALDALEGTASWPVLAQRWLRSWTVIFTFASTGFLLLAALGRRVANPGGAPSPDTTPGGRRRWYGRWYESVGVVVLTLGSMALVLVRHPELPLMFVLFVPAAWVGARFSPLAAAVYAAVTGVATIALTLAGLGPFARVENAPLAAFLAQSFFAVLFTATLVLALFSTRLRVAEEEAHTRAELLDRLLATSTAGVLHLQDGRIVVVNTAARRLLGIAPGAARVEDLDPSRFTHPDGTPVDPGEHPYARAAAGLAVSDQELRMVDPDGGGERFLRVTAHPVGPAAGRSREVLLTVADVTQEHAHTSALAAFAGEVAHDLKNPLTVIEGWAEMLEGELGEEAVADRARALTMVRRVAGAAASMRTLITDLLSYTVARDHTLRLGTVDLGAVASEVAASHAAAAEGGPGAVRIEIAAAHHVLADPVLLRQLLDNLVGNAVKYVAAGTVPLVRISSEAEGDRVRVDVTDNGLGVPGEYRRRIFDNFFRLERPGYSGTGLGLSICARVVERHGGHLTVDDGPGGVGSTFTFTLATPAP